MKTSAIFPALLALAAALGIAQSAAARDWFATPTGSGKKDASTWQDAAAADGVQAVLDQLKPGDRLLLGGGDFPGLSLTLRASGAPGQPVTIAGQDRGAGLPVLASSWTIQNAQKGPVAFNITPGTSHVVLRDIAIRGYQHGVKAAFKDGEAARTGWRFENVDMTQIRHGFYISGFTDLRLIGCDLKRYSKHAFRFDAACTDVTLQGCTADCSEGDAEWEKLTEAFPFGFTVNDGGAPSRNIVFEDCVARNNMMPLQTGKYKNGDGFVVEGNSQNVTFKRCRALRNQDGGFDLKVADVRLDDCVAIRNKRDFRIWKTGRLTNCLAGWSQAGLWTKGGPVIAERCTIAAWKTRPADAEDTNVGIELRACLLASDGSEKPGGAAMKAVTLTDCVKTADLAAAGLKPPPENWTGEGSALDSATHPKHGYRAPAAKTPARP